MSDLKVVSMRPMAQTDVPYIYNTWLEDFYSSHHVKIKGSSRAIQTHVALMPKELYFKEQRAVIDKILKKSYITVACNSEDEHQIFGYIVHRQLGDEIGIISWIYVRPVYRGFGIAKKLLESAGEMHVITHALPKSRWFLRKFNLVFNPYMENK